MEYSISWFGPLFISEEWSNGLAAVFNKKTFFDTITDNVGVLSKSTLEKYLKKYLESGEIVRIGRNAYCVRGKLKDYEYDYSDIAVHIAKILNEDFCDLDFRISELYQMNRFLNHQIAHNVIFVFVEKELCISAFERLKKEYEGNILINPTEEDFFNYRREDMIVVRNLLTESPKGKKEVWHTGLEKLLVDIFSENLINVKPAIWLLSMIFSERYCISCIAFSAR